MISKVVFCLLQLGLFLPSLSKTVAPVNSIPMKIFNHAGAPIELFWIDSFTKPGQESLVKQTTKPIRNNSDTQINSYDTHEFMVKFLKPIPGAQVTFTKGPREENVYVTYDPALNVMSTRQTTKFNEIVETVNEATENCAEQEGDKLAACIATAIMDDVQTITDAKTQLTKYRDLISYRLRNYTCADPKMETSAIERSYDAIIEGKRIRYDILLDTSHAKIWLVDDFITPEECGILEKFGRPRLARATVAAEDGSSVVSENRKAQQASYTLHAHGPTDPLWPLYMRVLGTTNHHTGFKLEPPGQEDFTIIQYNPTDQYTPHCDGSCDHSMHIPTGRVATAVLYCKVAEEGGGTTFTRSDIFVKPKVGSATFFSYKGKDGRMDDGYTEHSGCPVLKGDKWITTVWMREGVTDQKTWMQYDPNGVRMMEEGYDRVESAVTMNGQAQFNPDKLTAEQRVKFDEEKRRATEMQNKQSELNRIKQQKLDIDKKERLARETDQHDSTKSSNTGVNKKSNLNFQIPETVKVSGIIQPPAPEKKEDSVFDTISSFFGGGKKK